MTLQELGRGLLRSAWTIGLSLAIVLVAVGGYVGLTARTYTAKAQLFISATTAGSLSQSLSGSQLIINTIQSYALLVKSDSVTGPVVSQLRLALSPAQLAGEITTTVPLNTLVLELDINDASAAESALIANALANQLVDTVATLSSPAGNGVGSPVRLTVVQHAVAPSAPSSPKTVLDLALGVIVGLGVGIALAVLRGRFSSGGRPAAGAAADPPGPPLDAPPPYPARREQRQSVPSAGEYL